MKPTEVLLGDDSDSPGSEVRIDVREYAHVIASRWRLIATATLAACALSLLHFFLTAPEYQATALLQIEQRSPLAISSDSNPYLEAWLTQKYYPTQYRLLRSRGLAERVIRNLKSGENLSADPFDEDALATEARKLLGGITVDPITGTELVSIAHVSADPERSAEIVNTLSEEYINWSIENRAGMVDRTSRFLTTELEAIQREIGEKESQLEEYSRRSDIVSLDPSSNLTLQSLEKLNQELLTAQGATRNKGTQLRELDSQPREAIADRQSNSLIAEMRREQLSRQAEYESKLLIYKPDWPEMIELKAALEDGERSIAAAVERHFEAARQQLRAEYQTAQRQEGSLRAEISRVKSEALDLNAVSVEYNNLRLEIDARRERQDEILRQLSSASMSARMFGEKQSNVRIVERALIPKHPFRPSLRNDLLAGLIAGLVFGVGLALLLHFLDRTIKNPEELERVVRLPLLGVIPDISDKARGYSYYGYGRKRREPQVAQAAEAIELLPAKRPRLAVSEAYRSLRTALLLSSAAELDVISVTSAESGEGKTATSTNLAVVLSQLGKRVLLVDADLRKPRLYKIFGLSNRSGLVNYLTGTASSEQLCIPTSEANLWLCPAGPHPPNPSELLASDKMESFLAYAKEQFDIVLVDTPPVLVVTDAVLVGRNCDGVILCFRANKVLRDDVTTCRARLQISDVRILGTVLNRYQPTRAGGYGRRYYYYYESYGEETQDSTAA